MIFWFLWNFQGEPSLKPRWVFGLKSLPTRNFFHNKQIHVLMFKPLKGHTPVLLVQRRTHFKQLVFIIWSSREGVSQKQQYHSFMYTSCKQESHSNLIGASQKAARKESQEKSTLFLASPNFSSSRTLCMLVLQSPSTRFDLNMTVETKPNFFLFIYNPIPTPPHPPLPTHIPRSFYLSVSDR